MLVHMNLTDQLTERVRDYTWLLTKKLAQESEGITELTAPQENLMVRIYQNPGLTGAELARHLYISPQSVNITVTPLISNKLVEVHRNPTDGRRRELHLTPAGRTTVDNIRSHRTQWLSQKLGALTEDEKKQLLTAIEILHKTTFE